MVRVFCAHQSAEMYGSDRSFLLSMSSLKGCATPFEVDVVLPEKGPLYDRLLCVVDKLELDALVKIKRSDIKTFLLFRLFSAVARLPKLFSRFKRYDVVYVNTVVVFDFLLAFMFWGGKKIVHVREIPTGVSAVFFSWLIRTSGAVVFFNSAETAAAFGLSKSQSSFVIHNGTVGYREVPSVGDGGDTINVLVIGRLNSWKGQGLLLDAAEKLDPVMRERVRIRVVGSPALGQDEFRVALEARARELDGVLSVEMVPFSDNPDEHFAWSDVVVVPSTKPEPFGLVAIEGMSAGRPIIAAAHGGLLEIVQDGRTGLLFQPGVAEDLTSALSKLCASYELRKELGDAGRQRFLDEFSDVAYSRRFVAAVKWVAQV